MPKFHLSASGKPAPCKAKKNCPLSDNDGNAVPHADFDDLSQAQAWAEQELEKKYGSFENGSSTVDYAHAEPELTPREIRAQIALAVKSKQVWQGGDTELAAQRTKANVQEQEAKIAKLEAMLPENEPKNDLQLLRKVLFNEGGEANADEMIEYLDSHKGGYISDREIRQREVVRGRLAAKKGFKLREVKNDGFHKVTDLGNGYIMEETNPTRTWGGSRAIRDDKGREVERQDGTRAYLDSTRTLAILGEHVQKLARQ